MLKLVVRDGAEELVGSLLWDAGTTGLVEADGEFLAGFDDRETAEAVAERAADWPVDGITIEPSDWAGTDEVTTVTIDGTGGPGAIETLSIVAGPTFGHGGHPTTALAIELLTTAVQRRLAAGSSAAVLDVGTGSGVLAIAAAALGAGPVLGVDNDRDAVEVATANAERNGVEIISALVGPDHPGHGGLTIADTPPLVGVSGFDLVVMNVLAPVQRALAGAVAGILNTGGSLITTGYLIEDGRSIVELHRAAITEAGRGLATVGVERCNGDWLGHRFDLEPGHGTEPG